MPPGELPTTLPAAAVECQVLCVTELTGKDSKRAAIPQCDTSMKRVLDAEAVRANSAGKIMLRRRLRPGAEHRRQ